ncbi:MAG: 4'-phosphopantetheinyl transferase superfamily protein [Propionibacteriales bacterium]|nr:4'-phosphopantetheinyl transferase superfamily protein [Propionibacteriales bacterium]
MTSLVASLLPPEVVVHETRRTGAVGRAWRLLAEEERREVPGAGERRRDDWATGRLLAHAALAELGEDVPVLRRGERGEPLWPDGVVGSITHCDDYAACAAAHAADVSALGIDVEPSLPLPPGVLQVVATPEERRHLADLADQDGSVPWDRLLFCAKEACYKVWFPVERRWLGFEDADVRLDPDGSVEVTLGPVHRASLPARLRGRWGARDGVVAAAMHWGPAADGTRP